MKLLDRLHMRHRFWRYRLRSEKQELSFVLRCQLRGATVLDIGANLGIYSFWLHRAVGVNGSVFAFEPQPELATHLQDLKSAFRLKNLRIQEVGLSSRCGEADLIRPVHHWGGSSLECCDAREKTESFRIPLKTLDQVFPPGSTRVRFIKCDVEGHEFSVFRGGIELLQRDKPILLFECPDHLVRERKFFRWLEQIGYQGLFFAKGHLFALSEHERIRSQIDRPYLNFVFCGKQDLRTLPMRALCSTVRDAA